MSNQPVFRWSPEQEEALFQLFQQWSLDQNLPPLTSPAVPPAPSQPVQSQPGSSKGAGKFHHYDVWDEPAQSSNQGPGTVPPVVVQVNFSSGSDGKDSGSKGQGKGIAPAAGQLVPVRHAPDFEQRVAIALTATRKWAAMIKHGPRHGPALVYNPEHLTFVSFVDLTSRCRRTEGFPVEVLQEAMRRDTRNGMPRWMWFEDAGALWVTYLGRS
jgi:hypothetical protein